MFGVRRDRSPRDATASGDTRLQAAGGFLLPALVQAQSAKQGGADQAEADHGLREAFAQFVDSCNPTGFPR